MVWQNDDGLTVRFGTEKPVSDLGGEQVFGIKHVITIDFDYADLPAHTAGAKVMSRGSKLVPGHYLESATLTVLEAFDSGGSATLTIGTIDTDESTTWDADGIDVAIAETAIDTEGEIVNCDGDQVGSVLSNSVPGYVIMST